MDIEPRIIKIWRLLSLICQPDICGHWAPHHQNLKVIVPNMSARYLRTFSPTSSKTEGYCPLCVGPTSHDIKPHITKTKGYCLSARHLRTLSPTSPKLKVIVPNMSARYLRTFSPTSSKTEGYCPLCVDLTSHDIKHHITKTKGYCPLCVGPTSHDIKPHITKTKGYRP